MGQKVAAFWAGMTSMLGFDSLAEASRLLDSSENSMQGDFERVGRSLSHAIKSTKTDVEKQSPDRPKQLEFAEIDID